ncbi:MAG: hypothetical protein PHT62_01050 [Desulfotomaculaceae bacterium]|nr:hypothetical protein [Desulfotomaculaceae bacterium]
MDKVEQKVARAATFFCVGVLSLFVTLFLAKAHFLLLFAGGISLGI